MEEALQAQAAKDGAEQKMKSNSFIIRPLLALFSFQYSRRFLPVIGIKVLVKDQSSEYTVHTI